MKVDQTFRKIGLLDHLGHGNLGDDATLTAVLSAIRSRCPDAEFVALCLNPFDTTARHGLPARAIRRDSKLPPTAHSAAAGSLARKSRLKRLLGRFPRLLAVLRAVKAALLDRPKAFAAEIAFLVESFRIVRRLDLLVLCGGGQLLDSWGGPWSFPYTLLKWVALARLAGVKCYVLNVGAGPLQHPLSRAFIRYTLQLSGYVSFRDRKSESLVRELGYRGASHVLPDNVYALDITAVGRPARGPGKIVGISPMVYCDPRVYWEKDQGVYDSLIRRLAAFGRSLVEANHQLALFSSDIRIDIPAIADLAAELQRIGVDSSCIAQPPVQTTEDLLAAISSVDYLVTCRFHGVVFAHLLNKPVMALSHHPKVATLMADFGLSEYCLDIRSSDETLLADTFAGLAARQDRIKAHMAAKVSLCREELMSQFDAVFLSRDPLSTPAPSLLKPAEIGESAR